jgi:type III pantothenate kinase
MILCDVGNTSYHFQTPQRSYKEDVKSFNPENIKEKVYYISVNISLNQKLKELENWIDISPAIDMQKYYKTMGKDRIVAIESVSNAVIVDAGSAITVDVVRENVFEGGFIFPGLNAMQKAYKQISPALDYAFNLDVDLNKLAKNSQDAISYGALKLLYSEVVSHKLPIILTGGDALSLQKVFKDAKVDETVIFSGMKKLIIKL